MVCPMYFILLVQLTSHDDSNAMHTTWAALV